MADNDKSSLDSTSASVPPPQAPSSPQPLPPPADGAPPDIAEPRVQPPHRKSGHLLLLGLVCAGALIAGGIWLWQQLKQRDAELVQLRQQIEHNARQLDDAQRQLQKQLEVQVDNLLSQANEREQTLQQRLAEVQQGQAELQQRLEGQQQRLDNLSTTSREDWLLAEAEYLLNVANQRVLMERSTANVLALLRAADDRLQQASEGTGAAALFAVRKALSEDIVALEKVEPVDKAGVYLRLYALAETLDELPRLEIGEFADMNGEVAEEPAVDAVEPGWAARLWQELKKMAGSLDRYIRIDDVAAPAKPLIDSYATQLASLNVRLLLEQAQLAVLQGEPAVYRHSIEKAQLLLVQYYVDSEQSRRLRDALAELVQLNVAPTLPDISQSRTLLRDYLRQLHRVRPAPEGQL